MTAPTPHSALGQTEQRPAGIVTRSLAAGIDLAVVIVVCSVAYLGLALARLAWAPTSFTWPDVPFLASVAFAFAFAVLYLTIGWVTTGRSYGGYVMGLRVLTNGHRMLRWAQSFLRAVFCVFFPVGLAWVIFSPKRRSLQDVVLRTTVVYDWHVVADS
ncbi:RDD family protein [Nakamurella multipartita]|mgnify:FL=1|uniref:RDD domain containing protein n=1 Tax=Nakamurella multipartita (strain ATCC 700099 / DSM 44233 / CIP 104796 / JCM 9543 / NBRC 105858 / Y-104) TaxID=479431 RepID=C8XC64_NAKMY|nr:RDD family protein [Nakamurella multipartita]ACV81458.1 RDD domain containing protein [Nakamurella multipartita DSM 44233]HOZ57502.1 RDD family protein [Nakamurella multipartita]